MKHNIKGIGMTSQRTRERLVQRLREKGIHDEEVLSAMARVPRHVLIDEALATRAYEDTPLPIGFGQTISQPYIVARMTQVLRNGKRLQKVLEIGTGSGYQTAVLAELAAQVFTVERIAPLCHATRQRLRELAIDNVQFRCGDGSSGWREHAPYDAIIVTAAAAELPLPLIEQLLPEGRLVLPVGADLQELLLVTRTATGHEIERLELVNFVPLIRDGNE